MITTQVVFASWQIWHINNSRSTAFTGTEFALHYCHSKFLCFNLFSIGLPFSQDLLSLK